MARTEFSWHTIAQIVISLVCGIIGCGILWSLTWDAVDGDLGDFSDHHHAFNFNVASVLIALLTNIITTQSESRYTRAVHYFALGITGYLFTGMGTASDSMIGLRLSTDTATTPAPGTAAEFCTMGQPGCIGLNPVGFPEMNRVRMKITRDDDDITSGQKKLFAGALFCQLSLFVGMLIPLRWLFARDRVIIKLIFFCCTIGCGMAGNITLFSSKITDDEIYPVYSSVLQCVAVTFYIMVTTTVALVTSNHAVAKFTSALAGIQGWLLLPSLLTAGSLGKTSYQFDDGEVRVVRLGAVLTFFSAIASVACTASILGGEDGGDNEKEAAKAIVSNSARKV